MKRIFFCLHTELTTMVASTYASVFNCVWRRMSARPSARASMASRFEREATRVIRKVRTSPVRHRVVQHVRRMSTHTFIREKVTPQFDQRLGVYCQLARLALIMSARRIQECWRRFMYSPMHSYHRRSLENDLQLRALLG